MADPIVHLTNGIPDSGTGNITTLGAVVTALGTPMQATGGSVTANAGTNLNTSALALETGGNLASIVTKLTSLVTGTVIAAGSALMGIVEIGDGTNTATVKAASTLPASTDTAIVVTERDKTAVGQQPMNASLPVALASDQSWPVSTIGFMKKEDIASADGDAGIPAMAIQNTTPADTASTDGDWSFLQVKNGRLWASAKIDTALPAGTNLLGIASASNETSTIYNGTTALTPTPSVITASASGATTIVAATSGKKIRVLQWDLKVNAAVNFKWQSHVTPTDVTGLYYCSGQGDGVARGFSPIGYFETIAGEALDINLSGAVAVGGHLRYVLV